MQANSTTASGRRLRERRFGTVRSEFGDGISVDPGMTGGVGSRPARHSWGPAAARHPPVWLFRELPSFPPGRPPRSPARVADTSKYGFGPDPYFPPAGDEPGTVTRVGSGPGFCSSAGRVTG